jgi:hypothetical protein
MFRQQQELLEARRSGRTLQDASARRQKVSVSRPIPGQMFVFSPHPRQQRVQLTPGCLEAYRRATGDVMAWQQASQLQQAGRECQRDRCWFLCGADGYC